MGALVYTVINSIKGGELPNYTADYYVPKKRSTSDS
jgi:hypothetical protein